MATWYNLTFSYLEILSHTKMNQLDGNLDAIAEGSSGAPKIQTAAINDAAVTWAKLDSGVKTRIIAFAMI